MRSSPHGVPLSFERRPLRTGELALVLALLALLAGCNCSKKSSRNDEGPAPVTSTASKVDEKPTPKEVAANDSRESGPESLTHCLSPPYMRQEGTADAMGDLSWSVMTCPNDVKSTRAAQPLQERRVVLWPSSVGRAVDIEIARDVAAVVKEKLGHDSNVGAGLCCNGAPRLCVHVEFPLCSSTSAQIEKAFTEAVELRETRPLALGLAIKTGGYIGPRCSADDPGCEPFPYNDAPAEILAREPDRFALPYDAKLPRRVLARGSSPLGGASTLAPPDRLTCGHDGDCVPGCLAWRDPRAGRRPAAGALKHALLDAYCGCVEGACQYFESVRPLVRVRFEGKVLDWGEHPSPDPRRFIVGFGNGQQVVAARLERKDMVRHMTRCFLGRVHELPKAIEFSMTIPKHRNAGSVNVHLENSASSDAERCTLRVLKQQRFPHPPSAKDVSVEGTLHLTLSEMKDTGSD